MLKGKNIILSQNMWQGVAFCLFLYSVNGKNVEDCDRGRSTLARAITHQVIFPHIEWSNTWIPGECVLHPDRDMFSAMENLKLKKHASHWECDSCGKKESLEELMDDHVHDHHGEKREEGGDVCLADLCDVLHCDYLAEKMDLDGTHKHRDYIESSQCDYEKTLVMRRQCNDIADNCFTPEGGKNAHIMWDYMRNEFCGAHVCDQEERHQILRSIVEGHHKKRWTYYLIAMGILGAGILFVVAVYLYERLQGFTLSQKEWQQIGLLKRQTELQKRAAAKQL